MTITFRNLNTMLATGVVATTFLFGSATLQAQGNRGANGASNGQPFQALQEAISAEEAARIAADAAEAAIRAQNDAALQDSIDLLNEELETFGADTSALEADVAELQNMITYLETDLALLQDDATSNEAAITQLMDDINALDAELASKQEALSGSCAAGSSLRVIYPDGGYLCEFDDAGSNLATLARFSGYASVPRNARAYRVYATCPAGYRVTGGGHYSRSLSTATEFNVLRSYSPTSARWEAVVSNTESAVSVQVRAFALCSR